MIHFHHRKTKSVRLETFSAPRNKSQPVQHESPNGLVRRILRHHDVVPRLQFPNFDRRVKNHSAIRQIQRPLHHVELIMNFTDHLLQNIFQGRQPQNTAKFIHDHRQPRTSRPEFPEQFAHRLRFRDNQHVAQNAPQAKLRQRLPILRTPRALQQNPNHVLDVHESQNLIERIFIHGNPRALGRREHGHGVVQIGAGRQRMHIRPRDHHFAHLHLPQFHRRLNKFHFGRRQQSAVPRLLHHHLQLFGRPHQSVAVRRHHPQRQNDFFRETIEQIDGPAKRIQKPLKRAGNQQRHPLGPRQAQTLRHQFAQHHLQNRQQPKGHHQRNRVRRQRRPRTRNRQQQRAQHFRQGHFPEIPQRQTRQGNSHLHSGHDPRQIAQQLFHDFRPRVALLHKLADARLAHRHQRKFRSGEKCVDTNQRENSEEL